MHRKTRAALSLALKRTIGTAGLERARETRGCTRGVCVLCFAGAETPAASSLEREIFA